MEVSRLPAASALTFSSATSRQIVASASRGKQLGVSGFPSSRTFPRLAFSCPDTSCPKLPPNGSHLLKAFTLKAQVAEQGTAKPPTKKNDVLFRFLRPFAITVASVQFSTVLTRRLMDNPHLFKTMSSLPVFIKIHVALACIACSCFFTSGINQIFDIETDKISKPHLPLSSGELPIESAWLMMMSFVAISLVLAGILNSFPFLILNLCSLIGGAIYSVPPLRFKASTIGAPMTIGLFLGVVQLLTMFAGAGAALGLPFQMRSNIATLATIIGVKKTLLLGVGIHILNHLGWVLASLIRPTVLKSRIMIPAHIVGALYVIHQAWKITQINYEPRQSGKLYFSMWRAYYLQFIMFPFV